VFIYRQLKSDQFGLGIPNRPACSISRSPDVQPMISRPLAQDVNGVSAFERFVREQIPEKRQANVDTITI
jgi:hypothetical protein